MHTLKVSHKVSLSLFAVFCVVSMTIYPNQVAMATPLAAGNYDITSGDLIGGSFSITGTGEYSAWNITFPATFYNSPTTFESPSPAPSFNAVINGISQLTFEPSSVFFTLNTTETGYDYTIVATGIGLAGDGGGAVELTTIPEPSTLLLSAIGLMGLAGYRRSQCRREPTQFG